MLTKLGKYQIKSELGHGAMGVVYLAEDPRLHRPVALKTMSSGLAGDQELLKRFYREAESAGQLHHPNIVTIYDIDEADGIPFIAMEFLEGEPLERIIQTRRELTGFQKLDIILQTCRALHYAHKRGIVHRDVKPANIMVLNDGMVKLVDFGIAHISEASITRSGLVLGTPMYMSPEQIRGVTVDARTDIFAMGVILYEFLTYTNPFYGDNVPSIIYKVLNEAPPPVTTVVQDCPPALDAIVTRAMAKDRGERYHTAEDMAFELQQQADYLKRHMISAYVDEGQRLMGEGNLTLARESLQKALGIDSGHNEARNMLSQVQELIQTRQSQEKVEQGLRRAGEALQAGLYDDALECFEEVLSVNPGNPQAEEGKKFALTQRERQRVIAERLEQAEEAAAEGNLEATQAAAEKLLAVDPQNKRASQLIEWAKKEIAEQKRLAQVQQYVEAAQAHLSGKDFAAALGQLEKARALDPVNIEIESLQRSARESLKREERKKLLNQQLGNILEAITAEHFDRAVELADACLREFPNNSHAAKLRAQAARQGEQQKERRYVEQQLHAATGSFQKNDFAAAIEILQKTLEKVPGDARLQAYLNTVRDAQKSAEMEEVRRAATNQANELLREEDFAGAIRVLEKALRRAGQSPELADLLQFARGQQAEREQQGQLTKILEQAEGLAASGDLAGTVAKAEKLLALDPENKRALQLLDWAKKEMAEQERKKVLNQKLRDIQEAIARENFDRALLLAGTCLAEFPNNAQALELRDEAARQAELQKKRLYVEEQLRAAREALQKKNFPAAIAILEKSLASVPGDERLAAYLKTVRTAQKSAELEEVRRAAAAQAHALIGAQDFAGAVEVLEDTFQRAGLPPDLVDLLKFARTQQTERQTKVRQALASAQACLREEKYEEAIRLLERCQREAPAKEIAEALSSAQAQLQEYEQRREETVEKALQLLRAGDPAQAVSILDAAPKAYFKDARFTQVRAQCREELDSHTAIRQTTEQVDKNIANENWSEAERLLRVALGTYPGDSTLLAARQKVQEAQAAAVRRKLVKRLEEAQLALSRSEYNKVTELLSPAAWPPGEFPDLAKQAGELVEEAHQRVEETRKREEEARRRAEESALQQTVIQPTPPPAPPPAVHAEAPSLRESQEQLRQALPITLPPRREESLRAKAVSMGGPPAEASAEATPRPPAPHAVPRPVPPPQAPIPPAPAPVAPKPAAPVRLPSPPAVRVPTPLPVPVPVTAKPKPVGLWVGIGIIVVAIAVGAAWWGLRGGTGKSLGYAQVTAVPWAEVVSVKTKGGKDLNIKGETPLELELPPGDYVIQLQNGQESGETDVSIQSGKVVPVKYTFAQVNIDALVDKLVSK